MTCADYVRHERLLDCPHQNGVVTAYRMEDGCSGRLCPDCAYQAGVRQWPDVADKIAGPSRGLDVLDMLRALQQARQR